MSPGRTRGGGWGGSKGAAKVGVVGSARGVLGGFLGTRLHPAELGCQRWERRCAQPMPLLLAEEASQQHQPGAGRTDRQTSGRPLLTGAPGGLRRAANLAQQRDCKGGHRRGERGRGGIISAAALPSSLFFFFSFCLLPLLSVQPAAPRAHLEGGCFRCAPGVRSEPPPLPWFGTWGTGDTRVATTRWGKGISQQEEHGLELGELGEIRQPVAK